MAQRLEDWLDHLAPSHLPILHSSAVALERLAGPDGDDLGVRDLHPFLERDPALALNVMRAANSHHHRHLEARITTADQALLMLGMARTLELGLDYPTVDEHLAPAAQGPYLQTLASACFVARQAAHWAELRKDVLPAEISAAAMARHSASLALRASPQGQELMQSVDELAERTGLPAAEAEYIVAGFFTDELATALNAAWHLPTLALEYLLPENLASRRTLGIRLAMELRCIGRGGWFTPRMKGLIQALANYLGSDTETAAETIPAIAERVLAEYALDPPPSWFPLGRSEAPPVAPAVPRGACLAPRLPVFRRLMDELQQHELERIRRELELRHDRLDASAPVLTLAARALHHGLGMDRTVILLMNQDGDMLAPYLALGADTDPSLLTTRLRVDAPWLRSVLPPGSPARLLQAGEPDPVRQHLREAGGPLFDAQEYLVRTVHGRHDALALLFADRHAPECRLDARARRGFDEAAGVLEQAWAAL
ncbi:HDOD domain-containing protein [Aquisalimonas lutea]|uniref:HDOD domain-containing protein n=1 Tax=Aquisalimonas lutea TaxID=1327750 RepID=UPI0025B5EFDB|nr:HDOD domain-containing protein [Aquisalimonas lutea]MDN3518711.1 HDOD domain-containing protein [Aquisalimonas lutea]